MRDSVSLEIGTGDDYQEVRNFQSYSIESNLFTADDVFEFTLVNPEIAIIEGLRCFLYINEQLELNGIVDIIEEEYSKSGRKLKIKGRDLMGLLVDAYCTEFPGIENTSLKALTETLLGFGKKQGRIPYIRKIEYGKGDKERAQEISESKADELFGDFSSAQVEPGQTIFEVLKKYAAARGMLLFSKPDGTIVFGEPLTSGSPLYTLITRKDGEGNNIIEGKRIRDISQRYSQVTIQGQPQGEESWAAEDVSQDITILDVDYDEYAPHMPFYKPYVGDLGEDGLSIKQQAKISMERQQFESFKLQYKTYGHSQGGNNFQPNTICHVIDEVFGIKGDYLVYSRTFEMSKEAGVTTTLQLSRLGIIP